MTCTVIDVDGVPVRINLGPGKTAADLTDQDRAALAELMRAARKHLEERSHE